MYSCKQLLALPVLSILLLSNAAHAVVPCEQQINQVLKEINMPELSSEKYKFTDLNAKIQDVKQVTSEYITKVQQENIILETEQKEKIRALVKKAEMSMGDFMKDRVAPQLEAIAQSARTGSEAVTARASQVVFEALSAICNATPFLCGEGQVQAMKALQEIRTLVNSIPTPPYDKLKLIDLSGTVKVDLAQYPTIYVTTKNQASEKIYEIDARTCSIK